MWKMFILKQLLSSIGWYVFKEYVIKKYKAWKKKKKEANKE